MSDSRMSFPSAAEFTRRAEAVIPGGSHTYSRGRDRFPQQAPNGIVRGKGARVWDQDGNCLVDWSMGLSAVSLGHAAEAVNSAVCDAVQNGVLFQRTSVLEVEAAERFAAFTGDEMVKFARHGSSVTTAAVKLARAHTGRPMVAVPKEHPFFSFDDWFIGTTACDFGIPDELKKFTVQFSYNDLGSLEDLFAAHPGKIACVMLEPVKFDPPVPGFLEGIRDLCDRDGAVLVFDEMVCGLKYGLPGAAARFGIKADLSTWGKGIANGFSCAALTGRADIMRLGGLEPEGARKLFMLSTTHGGESVGLAAMMATLDRFADGRVVEANWANGETLRRHLHEVFANHGLSDHLKVIGYPCLMAMEILGPDRRPDPGFTTLLMQEVIAHGVLFQGLFSLTPSHGPAELDDTVSAFDRACAVYRRALDQGGTSGLLVGPAVKPVFRKHV
ncbi:MAG: glutamate-1-semialdehyde 2,1-aminomutase [Pseudomonadota bacterium]